MDLIISFTDAPDQRFKGVSVATCNELEKVLSGHYTHAAYFQFEHEGGFRKIAINRIKDWIGVPLEPEEWAAIDGYYEEGSTAQAEKIALEIAQAEQADWKALLKAVVNLGRACLRWAIGA